jgi:hypothetical protein
MCSSGNQNSFFYKLDDKTFQVIDSVASLYGQVLVSANGQYHYLLMGGRQVTAFDPANLSTGQSIIFSSVNSSLGMADTRYTPPTISNNNILLYEDATAFYKSTVIDLAAKQMLFQDNYHSVMSYDNKYLLSNGSDLYTFVGNTFSKVATLPYGNLNSNSVTWVSFMNNTEHLVIITSNSIIVYDCDTQGPIATYNLSTISPYAFLDQTTGQLLTVNSSGNLFSLLDLTTGNSQPVPAGTTSITFDGGVLFGNLQTQGVNTQGYAFKIN